MQPFTAVVFLPATRGPLLSAKNDRDATHSVIRRFPHSAAG